MMVGTPSVTYEQNFINHARPPTVVMNSCKVVNKPKYFMGFGTHRGICWRVLGTLQ